MMNILDIDDNKKTEPLIFYNRNGENIPFASLDRLKTQAPVLKKQFSDYNKFAQVRSYADIDALKDRPIVESKLIDELRTMIFLSENGTYKAVPLSNEIQWSTIQDMHIDDKGNVIYVANSKNMITEMGKNSGFSGGLLSEFNAEEMKFHSNQALPLPFDINPRKILALDDNKYFIVCNNGYQYIINNTSVQ